MKPPERKTYNGIDFEVRARGLGRFDWEFFPAGDVDPDDVSGTANGSRNKAVEDCRAAIDVWLEKNP